MTVATPTSPTSTTDPASSMGTPTTSSEGHAGQEGTLSAQERTRLMMDRYLQALLDGGDFAQFLADDIVWTTMEDGDRLQGRAAVAAMIIGLHTQTFDAHIEVKRLEVLARTAYLEAEFVGTHTGDFFGIPPTGVTVNMPYAVAYDLTEDSITSLHAYFPIAALVNAVRAGN